jgi:hypothetical protein
MKKKISKLMTSKYIEIMINNFLFEKIDDNTNIYFHHRNLLIIIFLKILLVFYHIIKFF